MSSTINYQYVEINKPIKKATTENITMPQIQRIADSVFLLIPSGKAIHRMSITTMNMMNVASIKGT